MNKTILFTAIGLGAGTLALAGTGFGIGYKYISSNSKTSNSFKEINNALSSKISELNIDVETSKDDYELKSFYHVINLKNEYKVEYKIQNYITPDLNAGKLPDNLIETKEGKAQKRGNIDLSSYKLNSDIFTNFKFTKNSFKGYLQNGNIYLKSKSDMLNFEIEIKYNKNISSINYSYYSKTLTKTEVEIEVK